MTENTTASGAADRYTKKPVTIDAIRWTGKNLREVIAFTDGPPDTRTSHAGMAWDTYADLVERDGLKIFTLEGKMSAAIGDWIIKGVKGEMYPCKDEIFRLTYEPVGEVVSASCDHATVRWLHQTSSVGGGDPRNSRAWPKVSGVSRDEGHSRALLVFFAAEPTDDEMRAVHDTLAASPTPPAEQQAAPKAAPGEQDDHQILAITTAYEQGVGKGHQAYNSGKEIANPYSPAYRCDLAWQYGYKEGKEQAQREAKAAPQQEAQEPCPTCVALARTVMLDQVSFDRKPDCYGIRQITDDEGVEEWEDIRTSPDVAREEANDMMATGRGEIYEVVPLWTTPQLAPQPAPDCHHRPPCDERAAIAAQGGI